MSLWPESLVEWPMLGSVNDCQINRQLWRIKIVEK